MRSGHPLDSLILHFRCPAAEEVVLALFQEVASVLRGAGGPLVFRQVRRRPLPDTREPEQAREEVWEAEGARIEIVVAAVKLDKRHRYGYEVSYKLILESGFRLEVRDSSPEPWPHEVLAQLYRVWPQRFDLVRDLFRQYLGADVDATDAPRAASHNARAAIDAGYGAFARHLIDQAMERRRTAPDDEADTDWWPHLEALARRAGGPKQD